MRILSKPTRLATALIAAFFATSCARFLPWGNTPVRPEVNLAFTLDRNLVELQTVRINDRPGRFLLGSAAPRTVLDPDFMSGSRQTIQISEKETFDIAPSALDLGGVADGIIGADVWGNRAISIDYKAGLVTYQRFGIERSLMTVYEYDLEPMIYVSVNGADVPAIVDTTSPDTVVLPSATSGRGTARVSVAGVDFGLLDVRYANVSRARVGNRVLAHFLVTIDYGKKEVGLFRDTRGS